MWCSYKQLAHLLFPPSLDEQRLAALGESGLPWHYQQLDQSTVSLLDYRDPTVTAAIHLAKFHHHPEALALLAQTLIQYLAKQPGPVAFVPIPLSKKRERERGYNQVNEIIKVAQKQCPAITYAPLLIRIRHTVAQTSLNRSDRLTNLSGAFRLHPSGHTARVPLQGARLILLDDVTTTGATLTAAREALLPLQPASVSAVALAH